MPLSYIIAKFILIFVTNPNLKFTRIIFDILGIVRLVIIPLLIGITGDKIIDNLPLGHNYFNQAVILISIEYIIGSLFIYIFSQVFTNKISQRESNYRLSGSKLFYLLFIIVMFFIFISSSNARNSVSFLIIQTHDNGRGTEDVSSTVVLIRMLFQLALALMFIISSYLSYLKYKKNPKIYYLFLPLIFGLINISLIVGERRSLQLYTLISILVIISLLFKKHSKKINTIILIVGGFVLLLMTLYKELYIFNYSSYSEALKASSTQKINFIDQIQSYFYGPSNAASAIDYLNYYPGSFRQFIFDNTRSIFGLNLFINHHQLITSQLFNQLIYGNKQLTGHLISSAGYGYIYFGPTLFFIVLIFNLLLSCSLEVIVHKTKSLELIFVGTYIYMRVIANVFGHTTPIITLVSSVVIIYSVIIITSMFVKKAFE
ncbi:capsular biosynthesis protein [Staphylococcus hominis]|uniref:capsular biosynthesis protein n=1 Tax=Staphylococcus hominis TaxID=1290 RepID=UPI0034D3A326